MKVVIDGRFVLDEADLQARLAGAFGYGPFYKRDLAALRDCLAAGDPRPLELTWIHADAIRLALGVTVFRSYLAVFEAIEIADERRHWDQRFIFRVWE
ncbi:barstar family protein [Paractinoplanes atraurantiacus]|uniref:Barstar, RNAse (Barnase) inhibitor n=1 Tax=Paractinoplanes atraurantiacus TaxID=1036182 RepID=A0A285HGM1_9ACTN|nr:barstar family protein [Actinoplanes atraurantiacus]SNY33986.1 Barstar, RNAse (barnase) inhibitor [Actinoplanes atraurantiacus]